jgi:hypothetical protein
MAGRASLAFFIALVAAPVEIGGKECFAAAF